MCPESLYNDEMERDVGQVGGSAGMAPNWIGTVVSLPCDSK